MRKPSKLNIGILSIALIFILMVMLQLNNGINNGTQETAIVEEKSIDEIEIENEDIVVLEEQEDSEDAVTEEEVLQAQATMEKKETANNGGTYVETPAVAEERTESAARSVDMSPITGETYTVKTGDSLYFIAQRADTSLNHLMALNGLSNDTIYAGQVLKTKGVGEPTAVATAPTVTTQPVSRGGAREDDIYWLSRIIHAEAQGEPYQGKVAVGNVILNRVKDGNFPNTIYGVVFDRQYGYTQFSPVLDGSIYNTPHADSVRAAQEALNGTRPVGEALYFLNPRKATNFWIPQNRRFMMTIGDHDFYY